MTEIKGQASPEQIEAWKKEKNVDKILFAKASLNEEQTIAYFIKPNRVIIAACMKKAKDNKGVMDNLKFLDLMRKNLFIGGDPNWLTDDALKNGFDSHIDTLMEEADVELGEL